MKKSLLSILAFFCLIAAITPAYARGGGGCVEQGTAIATPSGPITIEQLKPGDLVWAVSRGKTVEAVVQSTTEVEADEYCELNAGGKTLRVTGEHPVEIAPGVFKMASFIRAGQPVCLVEQGGIKSANVKTAARSRGQLPAYNLLVAPHGTYIAGGIVVHNKGCFLPETPIRLADDTEVPISFVHRGDRLRAFTAAGEIVCATVKQVLTHEVDGYLVVKTGAMILRVTPEHPFYVGNGTFKTIEALSVGDEVYAFDGHGLSAQKIEAIQTVADKTLVYNLQTDFPNTFFANGVAVHNKGGGCFPAGTMILAPTGSIPVEQLCVGDYVTGISDTGRAIPARIVGTHKTEAKLVTVVTTRGSLVTTGEHPLMTSAIGFCRADEIRPGDSIAKWRYGALEPAVVTDLKRADISTTVFNLTVEAPHTFVADGFVVHNKGGGGGHGGGFHGGGGHGGSGNDNPWPVFVFIGIFVLIIIVNKAKTSREDEDLDFVYSESKVAKKRDKTLKLLEFLSRQDQTVSPDALRKQTEFTFLTLQKCWQLRDYAPMKTLMMPDLFAEHSRQIAGMVRNHEINMIADLKINRIDLVNVRYTAKENQREFTALITATACDYYVDDRTQKRLRGDQEPAQFQEFWTFHYQNKAWILREIEQTRESDVLKEDNFFEQFTDTGVDQIYGKTADAEGPSGPWLEKDVEQKETKTERLLNFLVQTDKLWDRQAMLETSRSVFLQVTEARESGNPTAVPQALLFPALAVDLRDEIAKKKADGITMEFRNLCVRKVELILIRNFNDNSKDEFVVRVRAHAQRIVLQNGTALQRDDDVTPYP